MIKAPCYQCPDRVVGCHITCDKYIAYAEEKRIEREKRFEENQVVQWHKYHKQKIYRRLRNAKR